MFPYYGTIRCAVPKRKLTSGWDDLSPELRRFIARFRLTENNLASGRDCVVASRNEKHQAREVGACMPKLLAATSTEIAKRTQLTYSSRESKRILDVGKHGDSEKILAVLLAALVSDSD